MIPALDGPLRAVALALVALAPAASPAPDGDVPDRFGEYRTTLDDLREPTRAAVAPSGEIFVIETWSNRVAVHSPDGELLRVLGSGDGELRDPRGIAVSADGRRVFVADTGHDRVVEFDADGTLVRSFGGFGSGPGQLARPADVAVRGSRVVVSDTGNHRISEWTAGGRPVRTFGGLGSEPGRLREPLGVALDRDGRVVVADSGNHRVVLFDAAGEFEDEFGDRGSFPGLFSQPADVDAGGGRLYVADRGNHRIQVFDRSGSVLYEWGIHVLRPGEGEGHLHYPSGIALAPDGSLAVVCEGFSDRVQVFGPAEGPAERYMTDPALFSQGPARHYGMEIAATGDTLLVAEPETESVLVFALSGTTPLLVTRLGGLGVLADDLYRLCDVAIAAGGRDLVATDAGARRVNRYRLDRDAASELRFDARLGRFVEGADLDRLPLELDGVPIEREGGVDPGAVTLGPEGRIYIADLRRSRVLAFSPDFELLAVLGVGVLLDPSDLAVSPDGEELWVVDAGHRRLAALATDGHSSRTLGADVGLVRPHGLALAPDGTVWVTDAGADRVVVLDREGQVVRAFGRRGLAASEFDKPRGIAFDGQGHAIVLDHGNHRGQVFDLSGTFLSAFGARLYVRETRRRGGS